jgi:hypothetical protein
VVRNCAALVSVNGVTLRQCGISAKLNGGVKRYSPGRVPSVYGSLPALPSCARLASTAAAAVFPSCTPAAMSAPPPASSSVRSSAAFASATAAGCG